MYVSITEYTGEQIYVYIVWERLERERESEEFQKI